MGIRFRRRVRIAPGVSLNISKSGIGISAGPPGLRAGFGVRGSHYSAGAPGTGLHYRKQIGRDPGGRSGRGDAAGLPPTVRIVLHSDGTVEMRDADGQALPPQTAKLVRQQHSSEIQEFLEAHCARINGGIDLMLRVHHSTPSPVDHLRYESRPFGALEPAPLVPRPYGVLERLLSSRRARVDAENRDRRAQHAVATEQFAREKREHDERELKRKHELEHGLANDEAVMVRVLEERLAQLNWPRETALSFQLADHGRLVLMDVDLPEVEDIPTELASVAARGLKLNLKKKSETQVRKEYMQLAHGTVFRAIGEAFFVLPQLQEVVASAYSQRPDPATGNIRDDYLLSTRVRRTVWMEINFENLEALDVVACFERFELRRRVTKTGVFQPVEPFATG